jgi:hypothetical protein
LRSSRAPPERRSRRGARARSRSPLTRVCVRAGTGCTPGRHAGPARGRAGAAGVGRARCVRAGGRCGRAGAPAASRRRRRSGAGHARAGSRGDRRRWRESRRRRALRARRRPRGIACASRVGGRPGRVPRRRRRR